MTQKKKNRAAVALGKLGGRKHSEKRIEQARINGKKGGRPKKVEKELCKTEAVR